MVAAAVVVVVAVPFKYGTVVFWHFEMLGKPHAWTSPVLPVVILPLGKGGGNVAG